MWDLKKGILILTLMAVPFFFVGNASAEGMAYRELPLKLTLQVDGFHKGVVDMATTLQPGEMFKVELLSASGTGYQWQLEGEPILVKVAQTAGPKPLSDDKHLTGGPLHEIYIVKAGNVPGTETIHFTLARPWEDKSLAAKELAITVTVMEGK